MGDITPDSPNLSPRYAHLAAIDPEFAPLKAFVDGRLKLNSPFEKPINEFRAGVLAAGKNMPLPEGCPEIGKDIVTSDAEVEVRDGAKIGIRIYKSKNVQPKNALLYFKTHGGGWVGGSHEGEEAENRYVAALDNVVVLSVDYRLAPEHGFPTPLYDCFDVLKWCKENSSSLGINPENIIVGGSSSGGNLAAVLALLSHDKKFTGITAQVLNMPILCHPKHFPSDLYENGSIQQNSDASVLDTKKLNWFWDQYLPNTEPHIYASPLLAPSSKGLPAALIQICGYDPLRDEAFAYADKLKADGVDVQVEVFPGLPHGFYMFAKMEATKKYLANVVEFVKKFSTSA